MIDAKARRPRGAAPALRLPAARRGRALIAAFALFALAGCSRSAPPGAPEACVFAQRGGLGLLCCPDAGGRQRCFLSRGGIEI